MSHVRHGSLFGWSVVVTQGLKGPHSFSPGSLTDFSGVIIAKVSNAPSNCKGMLSQLVTPPNRGLTLWSPSAEVSARVAVQLARLGSLLHLISSCVPLPLCPSLSQSVVDWNPLSLSRSPWKLKLVATATFLLVLLVVLLLPLSLSPCRSLSLLGVFCLVEV